MSFEGLTKKKDNAARERERQQKEFWPGFCEQWDDKSNGKRYRSEVRSMSELWKLYWKGNTDIEEEPAKGKKQKTYSVVPALAREIPGPYHEKFYSEHHEPYHEGSAGYLHFPHWLIARDWARKNLYWLGKEVLGHDLEPHVHQVVCDQFVQKDFDGVFKEGYSLKDLQVALKRQHRVPRYWQAEELPEQYLYKGVADSARLLSDDFGKWVKDPIQEALFTNYATTMILLDPRGFFKSTIDVVDALSWLLNAPDIRILIVSGVVKLASQFLAGLKGHFFLPPGVQPRPLHYLFPEYVIRGVDGTSEAPLVLPDGVRQHGSLDPSAGVTSVGSNKAGFHCDVLKFDDIVTETNCLTEDTREAIESMANSTRNLMMPWGWFDIIGTRYFTDDFYGQTQEKNIKNPEDFNLKFFQRACWVVKPEFKHIEAKSLFEIEEKMVDLTFPEHAPFKHLRSILVENEKIFRCQQLNQPVWGTENPTFTHQMLIDHLQSGPQAYQHMMEAHGGKGEVLGAIDLAKEDKKFSDYTCIAVGVMYEETIQDKKKDIPDSLFVPWEQGKRWVFVILDVEFGKWSQTEIAYRIAKMNDKWRPKRWRAEDTGGLEAFKEKITKTSKDEFGHWPLIHWFTPNNQYNAKVNRIKGMEILIRDNRMFFMNASWNTDVFLQLQRYTGQKSSRTFKDDVPDCLSMLTGALPNIFPLTPKEKEILAAQKEREYKDSLNKAFKRAIFGDDAGGYGYDKMMDFPYPGRDPEPEQPSNDPLSNARRSILGAGPWR